MPKLIKSVGFAYLESEQIVQMTSNDSKHLGRIHISTVATPSPAHLLALRVPLTCSILLLELMATKLSEETFLKYLRYDVLFLPRKVIQS